MSAMTRQDYVDVVEDVYFGGMARGDVSPILALFVPDATITTFYADHPARRMRFFRALARSSVVGSAPLPTALIQRLWDSPTASTWAAFLVRTLNVVLVLPLVLRNFTDAETALWSVFSTLLMFQLLADFGFQTTFTRFTAYAFAGATDLARVGRDPGTSPDGGPNWELVRRITGTTRWLFRALGWVLFGLCMTLGTAFLWRRVEELLTDEGKTQLSGVNR